MKLKILIINGLNKNMFTILLREIITKGNLKFFLFILLANPEAGH